MRLIISVYKVKVAFSPYTNEGEDESDDKNKYAASFLLARLLSVYIGRPLRSPLVAALGYLRCLKASIIAQSRSDKV